MSWHRSRSPRNQKKGSEWISRQIASLGRYPEKRPPGLWADADGALSLKNLMECWGHKQGLKDQEVLNALYENMSHESGVPRFSLDTDKSGNVSVRVHKRKDREWWQQRDSSASHSQSWDSASHSQWQSNGGSRWSEGSGAGEQEGAASSRPVPTPSRERAFNLWGSGQSDAAESAGVWQNPKESEKNGRDNGERWKEGSEKETDQGSKWWQQEGNWESKSHGEQVQRWLGWCLKSGYKDKDVGIYLKGGEWGCLDILAEVLSKSKPHLNVHNARDLREVIEKTDMAGRFEINDQGEVRKVKRDHRVWRPQPSNDGGNNDKSWGTSWSDARRDGHESAKNAAESAKDAAAEVSRRHEKPDIWGLIGVTSRREASPPKQQHTKSNPQAAEEHSRRKEDSQMKVRLSPAKKPSAPQRPSPPPGEHWKKYVDEGFFWYYYEGPLGKWWCQSDDNGALLEVEPFPEDDEE